MPPALVLRSKILKVIAGLPMVTRDLSISTQLSVMFRHKKECNLLRMTRDIERPVQRLLRLLDQSKLPLQRITIWLFRLLLHSQEPSIADITALLNSQWYRHSSIINLLHPWSRTEHNRNLIMQQLINTNNG